MLREFLTDHRAAILGRARAKISARLAPRATEDELAARIPLFLDQLAGILLEVRGAPSAALGESAAEHGAALLQQGFTVCLMTMYNGRMEVPAGRFKATCLKLMERVAATGEPIIITKRGKPLARLVPIRDERAYLQSGYGAGKGTILYMAPDEELMAPIPVKWNALED